MHKLGKSVLRIVLIMFISGLLGATLVRFSPGFGIDEQELDNRLNHASVQALRSSSLPKQNLPSYYFGYVGRIAHGDWGYSKSLQHPVLTLIAQRFPDTLETVGIGLAFSWVIGMCMALLPFLIPTRTQSLDLLFMLVAGSLLCLPAAMLTFLFVIVREPVRLVVGLIVLPKVYRYASGILRQSASSPHVITAWAKGSSRLRVLFGHIVPVAAPQLLALGSISITVAFAAALPVEVIGDLPGIGQLAWKAALARDLELLVSLTLVVTFITLLANTASDAFADGIRMEPA